MMYPASGSKLSLLCCNRFSHETTKNHKEKNFVGPGPFWFIHIYAVVTFFIGTCISPSKKTMPDGQR